jgi:hypothetical protein
LEAWKREPELEDSSKKGEDDEETEADLTLTRGFISERSVEEPALNEHKLKQ